MIERKGRLKKAKRPFFSIRQTLPPFALLVLVWYFLAGDNPRSWALGLPAVCLAYLSLRVMPQASFFPVSFTGLCRFVPFFLLQSVRSGFDVMRRVLSRRLIISPDLITYASGLPDGAPLLLFANTISLLPGTLSVDLHGTSITVHILDSCLATETDLARLEASIAHLFSVPLSSDPRGKK